MSATATNTTTHIQILRGSGHFDLKTISGLLKMPCNVHIGLKLTDFSLIYMCIKNCFERDFYFIYLFTKNSLYISCYALLLPNLGFIIVVNLFSILGD